MNLFIPVVSWCYRKYNERYYVEKILPDDLLYIMLSYLDNISLINYLRRDSDNNTHLSKIKYICKDINTIELESLILLTNIKHLTINFDYERYTHYGYHVYINISDRYSKFIDSIHNFKDLEYLDMKSNQRFWTDTIINLTKLTYLKTTDILYIPDKSLEKLSNLKTLIIINITHPTLPYYLTNLTHLEFHNSTEILLLDKITSLTKLNYFCIE